MRFTRKDRGFMRSLLSRGTAVGPVTQEMIDLAVEKYEFACKMGGYDPEEIMWADFIGPARKEIAKG